MDGAESYDRLRRYLHQSGLMSQYHAAEKSILELPTRNLAIADLAAGIGWTSVLLSKLSNVGAVHAVELSRHRLELLFPRAVQMLEGNPAKLHRYLGSFYDLRFENASMDVVFLAQAFHHASNALRLMTEIDRVLKPGGRLIMIGENFISTPQVAKRMVKKLLTERRVTSNFYELFPPDEESGDHYYRPSDYRFFLHLLGYGVRQFTVHDNQAAVIVAEKTG